VKTSGILPNFLKKLLINRLFLYMYNLKQFDDCANAMIAENQNNDNFKNIYNII